MAMRRRTRDARTVTRVLPSEPIDHRHAEPDTLVVSGGRCRLSLAVAERCRDFRTWPQQVSGAGTDVNHRLVSLEDHAIKKRPVGVLVTMCVSPARALQTPARAPHVPKRQGEAATDVVRRQVR